MKHGESTPHNLLPPIKLRESLLRETGIITPCRVTEEIRKKVAEESEMIRHRNEEHYLTSRKKIKKEEAERLKNNEESRRKMTEKWKDMMARSPYHVDQLKEDDIRRKKMEEKELRVKAYREKVAAVAAMTGRAQETILTKENSKNLDPQTKLVLKLRQAYRDEAVIKTEKEILDSMLSTELRTIASKFSALPILDELSRSGTLCDQSTIESESKTNSQEFPQSKATASSSNNRSKNNKSPSAGGKKKENLENESSILSGPLEYTSPNARMKQLQDDVSVEFALKNYDSLDKLP